MCDTCGCNQPGSAKYMRPGGSEGHVHFHEHEHNGIVHHHEHDHVGGNAHEHAHEREIIMDINILQKNDLLAERNRGYFEAKGITAINLVSSPGSGKTSILERTIKEHSDKFPFYVIEGDQQTMLDADRINRTGAPVIQVNTGNGCHLDARMVNLALKQLGAKEGSVVMIENVGNLVCPALFDLGESRRVVITSVTEGEDKPLKYPNMFRTSHICLINKMDLLPYVDFDVQKFIEFASRVNNNLGFIAVSAKTGEGLSEWYAWLDETVIC